MARKVAAQAPTSRRKGVNRAQLKALAAQQAMGQTSTRSLTTAEAETTRLSPEPSRTVAIPRRQAFLSREQEYAYIRADLIRLVIVAGILLVALVATLMVLR